MSAMPVGEFVILREGIGAVMIPQKKYNLIRILFLEADDFLEILNGFFLTDIFKRIRIKIISQEDNLFIFVYVLTGFYPELSPVYVWYDQTVLSHSFNISKRNI